MMNPLFFLGFLGALGLLAQGAGAGTSSASSDARVNQDDTEDRTSETPDTTDPDGDNSDDDDGGDTTSGGDTSGGDTSGGDTSGGDTSGGDTSGGDTSGGDTSGGDTSGGDTSGGGTSGGDTSGGGTSGGDTSGGGTSGGGTSGGDTSGGGTSGGGGTTTGGGTTPTNPTPTAPNQTGGNGVDGGETAAVTAAGNVSVYGGRVTTLTPPDSDVVSVQITSDVPNGSLTVNPDNSLALVMTRSNFTGNQSFTYDATHSDGSVTTHTVDLNVQPGLQNYGWGTGESQYMLATDANDKVIVEHGDNHVPVYVSGAPTALTRADIAALEGIPQSQVTGSWLAANTTYGQSEATALETTLAMELWNTVSPRNSQTSNWLLFERGYEYDPGEGNFALRDVNGESELNPVYIGAWGTGSQPAVTQSLTMIAESATNLVVQDIELAKGSLILGGSNILFDNVSFSGKENILQWSDGITFHNSDFLDIVRTGSLDGGNWETHQDRYQGLFAHQVDGLLLDGLFLDHIAWADDYDFNGDASGGQPPSMFSHNLYLSHDNDDLTLRDSIIMRAASTGAQVRSGGYIEDNVFIDNNIGLNFVGGQDDGTALYTLFADNVVTGGGFHDAAQIGAIAYGVDSRGDLSALVDNIIAHAANPNDPVELAQRLSAFISYKPDEGHYYDDTIVYNWQGGQQYPLFDNLPESNVGSLDRGVLDQTTIQNFTAQLLGQQTATVQDLADFLIAQASDGLNNDTVDADTIIRYFQQGFGIDPNVRTGATTLRFVPDDLADGVRWDNRMNWDTDDLPGLFPTDSADLGGNDVVFGSSVAIDRLDLSGGSLTAYGGRLTLNGGLEDTGSLTVEGAGQIWSNGSDGSAVTADVTGGRFVNTGDMSGVDIAASGGQTILATGGAEFDVDANHTLSVMGSGAQMGFDGDDGGMAILDLHQGGTLEFTADDGDLGSIAEFRSGAFGNAPNVQSGIDLGTSTLSIDLSGLNASAGTAFTLMDADEIVGIFESANVGGLGARNATIVVDYTSDTVTLQLSANGNGSVSVQTVGQESDVTSGEQALWDALTAGQGVLSNTAAATLSSTAPEEDLTDVAA